MAETVQVVLIICVTLIIVAWMNKPHNGNRKDR